MFPAGAEKTKSWLQKFLDMVMKVEAGEDQSPTDLLEAVKLARTMAREGRLVKVNKHYKVGRDT